MEYRVHLGAETVSGLWSEQLVDCLTPIEVKPEIEPVQAAIFDADRGQRRQPLASAGEYGDGAKIPAQPVLSTSHPERSSRCG